MPGFLEGLGVLEWTLLAASVALVAYSAWTAFDQRASMRFVAPRTPAAMGIALGLAVVGVAYYVLRGMQPRDLVAAAVLVAAGVSLLLVRAGLGARGIYADGFRTVWSRVDSVSAEAGDHCVVVRYTRRSADRADRRVSLPGADLGQVRAFLDDMRKVHGIND